MLQICSYFTHIVIMSQHEKVLLYTKT